MAFFGRKGGEFGFWVRVASFAHAAHKAFAANHGVCDGLGAVARRKGGLFTEGAERGVVAEEGIDAFGVEDVVTRKFADGGALGCDGSRTGGDEVIEADCAGGLSKRVGGVVVIS